MAEEADGGGGGAASRRRRCGVEVEEEEEERSVVVGIAGRVCSLLKVLIANRELPGARDRMWCSTTGVSERERGKREGGERHFAVACFRRKNFENFVSTKSERRMVLSFPFFFSFVVLCFFFARRHSL